MKVRILLSLAVILVMSVTASLAQEDDMGSVPYELEVCDWGIVVVEPVPSTAPQMITIESPEPFVGIEGTSFDVAGTSVGLAENEVIVEAQDQTGTILFSEVATVTMEESEDSPAEWMLTVDLGDLDGATLVYVTAYAVDDVSTVAADQIALNANTMFGVAFVEITSPALYEGVSTSPLIIEGRAGAIFENNIVVQILDEAGEELLAETFATVQTDELAGIGDWSVEVDVELEVGQTFTVRAFQPAIADGASITVEAFSEGVADPFTQRYDRILKIYGDDPLIAAFPVNCDAALAEFENEEIIPITVNDLVGTSTMSLTPTVELTIEAADSSVCPLPIRARLVLEGDDYVGELYRDASGEPAACTMDLQPFTVGIPLGTQPTDLFNVTINGVSLNE